MQVPLEALKQWLDSNRSSANAYLLLTALTQETIKRSASPDPAQREFDALELAQAAGLDGCDEYEPAKEKVDRAGIPKYFEAREAAVVEHFMELGLTQAVRPRKRSTGGKHRALWFLEFYDLPAIAPTDPSSDPEQTDPAPDPNRVRYEQDPPGSVKPAWWARVLFSGGSAAPRSPRGVLWALLIVAGVVEVLLCILFLWAISQQKRPALTSDLMGALFAIAWAVGVWRFQLEPLTRLLDDRLIMAGDFWVGMDEKPAQLEMTREEDRKVIRLVRYHAVCPICSGTIDLRYSSGPNRSRIVGCCEEAPHDHVYSFDRVTRHGERL
jgi:hypothetical protein